MVALLEAFTGVGGVVGVALAFGLAPQLGWRVTYLAICGCVLYTGVLRFGIPESPRWLASVGRLDEAILVVAKIERAHGARPRYDNLKVQEAPTPVAVESVPSAAGVKASAFDRPVHTLVLWTLWTVLAASSYALGCTSLRLSACQGSICTQAGAPLRCCTDPKLSAVLSLRGCWKPADASNRSLVVRR